MRNNLLASFSSKKKKKLIAHFKSICVLRNVFLPTTHENIQILLFDFFFCQFYAILYEFFTSLKKNALWKRD